MPMDRIPRRFSIEGKGLKSGLQDFGCNVGIGVNGIVDMLQCFEEIERRAGQYLPF